MSAAWVLAFASLCAAATADTRTAQNGNSVQIQNYYELNSDIITNATHYSDRNELSDSGLPKFGYDMGVQNAYGVSMVDGDIIYKLTDKEYYEMPQLFHLDEYEGCLALQGAYCLGSFELSPIGHNPLFTIMQVAVNLPSAVGVWFVFRRWPAFSINSSLVIRIWRYSANWVDNYNHTRLHRGICLQRSCQPPGRYNPLTASSLEEWFASCVNVSTMFKYNLSASLYQLDYCRQGLERPGPLTANERGFAVLLVILIGLATISTALDLGLTDHAKKGYGWALSWSLRSSWDALTAPSPTSRSADLGSFDGLRVFCMLCVIIEHVCWLGTQTYIADTRRYEQMRRASDVVLMTNSTLVVQIFFLMASFLLAHKLLQQRQHLPSVSTFLNTMLNRIIRISPSYFVILWFAASWWERLGGGPQWNPLVTSEAAVCRHKWWTHLLYLNNVVYPDEKCLIQTWYLAADMQLYALALALTLTLRGRRVALPVLGVLFVGVTAVSLVLAYVWHLVPTIVVHRPESVRVVYRGDTSFNVLYQSPWGNAAGTLAGLLLAHLHHALSDSKIRISEHKMFRWASVAAAPAAMWWAATSPAVLGEGPPARFPAAALAALERPVFILLVAIALLGAINGVDSPWRRWLSNGGTVLARLSYGALLLHMPLNKSLLATRLISTQLDRQNAIVEWFGVAVVSYAAAVPLALLVELPAQRLHKELTSILSKPPPETNKKKPKVLNKTDLCPSRCKDTS